MTKTKNTPEYPDCPNGCGPMTKFVERSGDGTETWACTGCPARVTVAADDYYDASDKMAEYMWEGTVDGEVYDGDPADLDFF